MKTYRIVLGLAFLVMYYSCMANDDNSVNPKAIPAKANIVKHPVVIGNSETDVINIEINTSSTKVLVNVNLIFDSVSSLSNVASIKLFSVGSFQTSSRRELVALSDKISLKPDLKGNRSLVSGINNFSIAITPSAKADITGTLLVKSVILNYLDKTSEKIDFVPSAGVIRFAYLLRAAGEDNCNTYRIPGLATTNKGTLIAVYDNRYNNSSDIQGHIDVGMSRSTDGGRTWSPMKVIMDMGEWGGKPQAENGIGDPCVLVDKNTNTIWVAALWLNGYGGKMAWNASRPGLTPEVTGQFMLVKSEDDGITWSEPINITEQIKKPEWYLIFQGPGNGITMKDGTLVFPAQFKGANQVPHSTVISSIDGGKTWKIGTSAKSNTTEAQVVQLNDGKLMLNMRDDRNRTEKGDNNGRAVAVTSDLGQTWTVHPSSNGALPEPNCMASLISTNVNIAGKPTQVLLFSNPNNKVSRSNMTIKASLDGGLTWPVENQLELNADEGFGYSCMTMIDDSNVGIVYEGVKCLYYQIIPLKEIIKGVKF